MLIWQKYLKVLGQVSSTLPSSTSKYQVLSNFKVSSTMSTKYSRFCIKYQVQVLYLTPTLMSDDTNLVLCAVCWAHIMCHHELWPTSVSHHFSFLNSSWCLTGGNHYQKITITIFRFVLQNCTIPGYFPYICSIAAFSPYCVTYVREDNISNV